jgi:hydrogenase maturation protease
MKTLILGIGNTILTDDGVGIRIAQKIKKKNPNLEVMEASETGVALLDDVVGYDKLIIIDSIRTGKGKPGELYKLDLKNLRASTNLFSSHGIDIATAFELGQSLGYEIPKHISIYGVETKNNMTLGERCTEEIEEKLLSIVKQIMEEEKL